MKDQIIEIALRQLRLGGYDNLNFATIAAELGVTRANLHHHFKNKEGLALEAVKIYVAAEKEALDRLIYDHAGDLHGLLSAIEDHLITMLSTQDPITACVGSQLVLDSVAPHSLRAIALQRFRDEADDIARVVADHVQRTGGAEPQKLTFRIVSAMHGVDMMGQVSEDPGALRGQIKGVLTSLLD